MENSTWAVWHGGENIKKSNKNLILTACTQYIHHTHNSLHTYTYAYLSTRSVAPHVQFSETDIVPESLHEQAAALVSQSSVYEYVCVSVYYVHVHV